MKIKNYQVQELDKDKQIHELNQKIQTLNSTIKKYPYIEKVLKLALEEHTSKEIGSILLTQETKLSNGQIGILIAKKTGLEADSYAKEVQRIKEELKEKLKNFD